MGRHETLEKVRKGEMTKTDAAKLEGISRTRIGQLLKKPKKPAGSPAAAAPPLIVVNPEPFQAKAPAAAAPPLQPAGPANLNDVLSALGPKPGEPAPAVPLVGEPIGKIPVDGEGKPINPDDVEAGRELLSWIRRGASEFIAKVIYKANPDDPRLEKLKEENKFLKVSLKRNQDKAAPLGALTAGWWGLAIGFVVEMFKVATTFPAPPGQSPPPKPAAPAEPGAPNPSVKTVQEVREDVETGGKRLTMDEKIALMNKGK